MRRRGASPWRLLVLLAAASATMAPPAASVGRYDVETVRFFSPVLGHTAVFNIATPRDPPSAPLPLLIGLHGGGGDEDTPFLEPAPDGPGILGLLEPYDLAVVFPGDCRFCGWVDGLTVGEWTGGADPDAAPGVVAPEGAVGVPWERFLVQDLLPFLESHYAVRTDGDGRGVFGYSMGGFGAAHLAGRHPGLFAFVGTMSAPLHLFLDAETTAIGAALTPQIGDPVVHEWKWHAVNPWDLAPNLAARPPRIVITSGDGRCSPDPASAPGLAGGCSPQAEAEAVAARNARAYHERLEALGVEARLFVYSPGAHNDWVQGLPALRDLVLAEANRVLSARAPPS